MTAPPCNQTVNWFVMTKAIPFGLNQIGDVDLLFRINRAFARGRGNNRYTQPSNGRTTLQNGFVNNMAIDMSTSPFFSAILSSANAPVTVTSTVKTAIS